MKITPLRLAAVALLAVAMTLTGSSQATAASYGSVRVGSAPPPPPVRVDGQWKRPYRGAIWIEPHYEWVNGRWIWIRGYYTYPPQHGMYWIPPHYYKGLWYPGRWAFTQPILR